MNDEEDDEDGPDDEKPAADPKIDAATLDSEGRSVILEFPAFVLIGVYCPAHRDQSRDCFRMDFLSALDARVRNLVAMGKRVFVTGDINIAKTALDSAHALEGIRKRTTTEAEYISASSRRLFNSLLSDGIVIGTRDEGRELPVLLDICRSFHPDRSGMYTCWDTRLNTRPGNFGARIDYVLCSLDMQEWFSDSNIQEGLMVRLYLYKLARDLLTGSCLGIGSLPRLRSLQRSRALSGRAVAHPRYHEPPRDVQGRQAAAGILVSVHVAIVWTLAAGVRC